MPVQPNQLVPQESIAPPEAISCRLCAGEANFLQSLEVLHKYRVAYFRCASCGSVETETPYWLDEAYSIVDSNLDTGAVQRNLNSVAACLSMARIFGLKTGLDIGGGDGLLCRLLRDYGLDCYATDKYAQAKYSTGFTRPPFESPDLLTAFEVFEHFSDPATEYAELFAWRPKVILASTGICDNQPNDWWYFAPAHGQHVFLHSRRAFEWLAQKYNYRLLLSGGYILLVLPELWGSLRAFRARLALKGKMVALRRAQLAFKSYAGAQRDHEALRDRLAAKAEQPDA